ncbi:MAG: (Fe-S)-binding protein [Syntrophotaleaceae bacterium]
MKPPFFTAKPDSFAKAGLDTQFDGRQFSRLLREYLRFTRSLTLVLDCCTRCGNCSQACHSFLGTSDPDNSPVARINLFSEARRLNPKPWSLFCKSASDTEIKDLLERWLSSFYQCNLCRRCALACPLGLDPSEVVLAGRNLLTEMGLAPRFLMEIAENLHALGNNVGITPEALKDISVFLEQELEEETGFFIPIPIDRAGASILYIPSSTEFFSNVETLMGAAKLFHFLGVDWTLSSEILEAANYGLFLHRELMVSHSRRLEQTATSLGCPMVLQGECGHGWRAAKMIREGGGKSSFKLMHILEFWDENLHRFPLVRRPWRATLNDSCNYARSCNLVEAPRRLLRACVEEFVEMTPNRQSNYCCGGGGGLLMEEMLDLRMRLGKQKADQIRAVTPLDYLCSPCASCKTQMPLLLKNHGLGDIRVGGITELLAQCLVYTGKNPCSPAG